MTTKESKHPAVSFLKCLYQYCNDSFVEVRGISPATENVEYRDFIPLSKVNSVPSLLEANKHLNCYFGVATRRNGDGSKEGIVQIPALWIDLDLYKLTDKQRAESRERYKNFPLKATFVIDSGGGRYLVWMLKEPASKEQISVVEDRLKGLANYFHGDTAATDASRILRLPGSVNHKYQHLPQVKIVEVQHE